jgi:nucleotide-binding universal stress UspA family protein
MRRSTRAGARIEKTLSSICLAQNTRLEVTMTYSTIMVHLDVGSSNEDLLRIAVELVGRFRASVIGIAACEPQALYYGDGYVPGEVIEADRTEMLEETCEAEAAFRGAFQGMEHGVAWRSSGRFIQPAQYVIHQGRAADLFVTGPDQGWSALDSSRRLNVAEVVLHIGRPVLLVGRDVKSLQIKNIIVAWNETREARRAVADALPFLRRADCVNVVQVAAEEDIAAVREHLQDVVEWLGRHSVMAKPLAAISVGDEAEQLHTIATDLGAGLLVAGAFGHSRLSEWALGGVTRNLLLHSSRCTLLSH